MDIRIDFKYPKRYPWLRPMIDDEFRSVLRRAAEGQYAAYGRQFLLDDAVASGQTIESFEISRVSKMGDRMSISLYPAGDRDQLDHDRSNAEVMGYIELGRGPGRMPPRDAIVEWMEDRRIIRRGEKGWKVRALSYAIARAIALDGIEPRFILEKAERRYRPYVQRMFEAAVRRLGKKINARLSTSSDPRRRR